MAKVRVEYARAAAKRHGLDDSGGAAALVPRLVSHYRAVTPKDRLAGCNTCDGVGDVAEEVCPYCGDGAEDDGVSLAEVPHSEPPPQVQVQPASVGALDHAVARIHALKGQSAASLWELGAEIKGLFDSKLWKLRVDEAGAPRWRSWSQFCDGELSLSQTYAYKLMDVAAVYSRDEVREIGVRKLHITLQVPKEHRVRLLDEAAKGKSVAELEREAKEIGKVKKPPRDPKAGGGGARKQQKGGRKAEKVTVAALIGRVEIPLMKGTTDKPARSLADIPRGVERLLNGVTQVFVVTKDPETGNWSLIVERTRE